MTARAAAFAAFVLLCAGLVRADEPAPRIADHPRVADAVAAWSVWAEYQAALDGVPGMSVAIVHDQEVVHLDAFGFADPETGREATPDTLYSICSISKLFTSIAVMQQRDAGRLDLDDPVGDHLPWF